MNIRRAETGDIPRLGDLLLQVCRVHHQGRPDLFRAGGRKYTDEELAVLLTDPSRPILVAEDETGTVQGYAFCVIQPHRGETAMEALNQPVSGRPVCGRGLPWEAYRRNPLPGGAGPCPVPWVLQRDSERLVLQPGGHEIL